MDSLMHRAYELTTMLPGGSTLWIVLMFLVVLTVLVFFHELGHFLAARSVGVHVERFSIGFGRELFGFTDKKQTRWSFSLIPLGGYVKMRGEGDEIEVSDDEQDTSFSHKNVWQRMWVVVAGPLANFIFAVVVLTGMMYAGERTPVSFDEQSATIGQVSAGTPAQAADLAIGDKILMVEGTAVLNWMNLVELVSVRAGMETTFMVQRDDEILHLVLTPEATELEEPNELGLSEVGRIGVSPLQDYTVTKHGALDSVRLGFVKTYEYSALILTSLGKMITGAVSADQIGGPIMIGKVAAAAGQAGFYQLCFIMVIISVNLGLINLFPIPVLDGGHLLYYAIEAVKGSPVSEAVQTYGNRLGMALVLMLMTFAVFNDIKRELLNAFSSF